MKHFKFLNLFIAFLLILSCEEEAEVKPKDYPFVITNTPEVKVDGAEFSADITNLGNQEILKYGFVWSVESNPTILDNNKLFDDKPKKGIYSYNVKSGLSKGKIYYVRAYILTDTYEVYGIVKCFNSLGSLPPIITDFKPKYGPIGTQVVIEGENFALSKTGNIVKFGNTEVIVDSVSEKRLVVKIPKITKSENVPISVKVAEMEVESLDSFDLWFPWSQKKDFNGVSYKSASFSIGNMGYVINRNSSNMLTYNSENDKWENNLTLLENSGNRPMAFSTNEKAYVLLENGFWEYDPFKNNWSKKSNFPGSITNYMYSFNTDINGYIGDCHTNKELWQYNFSSDEWMQMSNFPGGYVGYDPPWGYFFYTINNYGYIGVNRGGGRKQFWEYNFLTGNWSEKGTYPTSVYSNFSAFVIGDNAYLGLGSLQNGDAGAVSNGIWEYDQENDSWVSYHNCPKTLAVYASFSINNKAFIMGVNTYFGHDDTNYVYEFDPSKN